MSCACGADRAKFRPTENVTASGYGGQPAAVYDVRASPKEEPNVEVKVWSRGAYDAGERTIVELTIEVQNTSDRNITLDAERLALEAFDREGRPFPAASLVRISTPARRDTSVPPGTASTVQLEFAIPGDVDPDWINSMRLRWALGREGGQRYAQFTEFRRVPEPTYAYGSVRTVYYDPVFGFYDPFFHGPPYGVHRYYATPVRRVIVVDRDRPRPERRAQRSDQ